MDIAAAAEKLGRAVARHLGPPGLVHDLKRLTGGAVKATWAFDAEASGARRELILQASTATGDDPHALPRLAPEQDAAVMRAARAGGVPAPEVLAVLTPEDGLGRGYITARVAGETLAPRILRDPAFAAARGGLAEQCGTILAAIHRVPTEAVAFLPRADAAAQLATYRALVDRTGLRHPALEYGLRWAEAHLPRPARLSLVHGDFRMGNLIVTESGVACVLDWELAVLGDPMQDLGWLCVKTWRFGGKLPVAGCGRRADLLAAYEAAGGQADPGALRFWEAFGCLKWAMMCLGMGHDGQDAEPLAIEPLAIGRRFEEPLLDFLDLIEDRDA